MLAVSTNDKEIRSWNNNVGMLECWNVGLDLESVQILYPPCVGYPLYMS